MKIPGTWPDKCDFDHAINYDTDRSCDKLEVAGQGGKSTAANYTLAGRQRNYLQLREQYSRTGALSWSGLRGILMEKALPAAGEALISGVSASSLGRLMNRADDQGAQMQSSMIIAQSITPALSKFAKEVVNAVATQPSEQDVLRRMFLQLRQDSAQYVRTLPDDLQSAIHSNDLMIEAALNTSFVTPGAAEKLLKRRELIYLAIPQQRVNVAHYDRHGDPEVRNRIDKNVSLLVESMAPQIRPQVSNIISQIRKASVIKNPNPPVVFLYGSYGVGKTSFVREIGKAFEDKLPIAEFNLSEMKPHDILGGSDSFSATMDPTGSNFEASLGKLMLKLISLPPNTIVFFDEADSALQESSSSTLLDFADLSLKPNQPNSMARALLPLLERKTKSIRLESLGGIEKHIDSLTFIFAGNKVPTSDALRSRCMILEFPSLTREQKANAARSAFAKEIDNLTEVFSQDEATTIANAAEPFLEFILDEDTNPKRDIAGGRIIQEITSKMIEHVGRDLSMSGRVDTALIRQNILDDYKYATEIGRENG